MTNFGHSSESFYGGFIDSWGAGPYTLRVGSRRYYFTDSDMFGPLIENKHGKVLDNQPVSERHPFWAAYLMWRNGGRQGKKVGRWIVCRWRAPRKGKLWVDARGLSHFICDPDIDGMGYDRVPPPNLAGDA